MLVVLGMEKPVIIVLKVGLKLEMNVKYVLQTAIYAYLKIIMQFVLIMDVIMVFIEIMKRNAHHAVTKFGDVRHQMQLDN